MFPTSMSLASGATNLTNFPYLMWYMMTVPPFILPTESSYPEVPVIENKKAVIPCDSAVAYGNDSIALMMIYKGNSTRPIYTLDSRRTSLENAKHFLVPNIRTRASISFTRDVPSMVLDPVSLDDDDLYKCRTEFSGSPTTSSSVKLTVVALPRDMIIMDAKGEIVEGKIGPFHEDENITLRCQTYGGIPSPVVSWWRGSALVDSSYDVMNDSKVVNEMSLVNLHRRELGVEYICLALNTNLSVPLSSSVIIDMHLRPLGVRIRELRQPFYEGRRYEMVCETWGSRPPSTLTWHLGNEEIADRTSQESRDNFTVSPLSFIPTSKDDGSLLSCQAHHSALRGGRILVDRRRIQVFYAPKLKVVPGLTIKLNKVSEGMDVYLDCEVHANPPVPEVEWYFGRTALYTNLTAGIVAQNRSLVLKSLSRHRSGHYQCTSTNAVGQGWSEPTLLQVKYAPVCRPTWPSERRIAIGDRSEIYCPINAYPKASSFTWILYNIYRNHTLNSTSQRIVYAVQTKENYGILCCLGYNTIGKQKKPCCIAISPEEPPRSPRDCNLTVTSPNSFSVVCQSDSISKSNKQQFHLEVFDESSKKIHSSVSKNESPVFSVDSIEPSQTLLLLLYTSNGRLKSSPINLTIDSSDLTRLHPATQNEHVKLSQDSESFDIRPYLIGLSGGVAFLVILSVITVCSLKKCKKRRESVACGHRTRKRSKSPQRLCDLALKNESPDVIPKDTSDEISDIPPECTVSSEQTIRIAHYRSFESDVYVSVERNDDSPKLVGVFPLRRESNV